MAETTSGYILVVEDVQFMRRQILRMISNLGYDALEAGDGAQAIHTMEMDPPSILLLDLVLPKVSGLEVCAWVRKNPATRTMPIIVCTASHERKMLEKAIRAGATDVLVKPFTKAQLCERITKHLSTAS